MMQFQDNNFSDHILKLLNIYKNFMIQIVNYRVEDFNFLERKVMSVSLNLI